MPADAIEDTCAACKAKQADDGCNQENGSTDLQSVV